MYVYVFYVSIIYSSRFLNGFLKRSLIIVITLHTSSSIIPSHTPSHLILWEGLGDSSTQRLSALKTVPPVIHPKDSPEDVSHPLLIYVGEAQGSHRKTVQQIQEPVTKSISYVTAPVGLAVQWVSLRWHHYQVSSMLHVDRMVAVTHEAIGCFLFYANGMELRSSLCSATGSSFITQPSTSVTPSQ